MSSRVRIQPVKRHSLESVVSAQRLQVSGGRLGPRPVLSSSVPSSGCVWAARTPGYRSPPHHPAPPQLGAVSPAVRGPGATHAAWQARRREPPILGAAFPGCSRARPPPSEPGKARPSLPWSPGDRPPCSAPGSCSGNLKGKVRVTRAEPAHLHFPDTSNTSLRCFPSRPVTHCHQSTAQLAPFTLGAIPASKSATRPPPTRQ